MGRSLRELYYRHSPKELDKYLNVSGTCVIKENAVLHCSTYPFNLKDKNSLLSSLATNKIGCYDQDLEGIVLCLQKVKLLQSSGAIRFDDPVIHYNFQADYYLFKPFTGAILSGTISHISGGLINVVLYQTFSVFVRLISGTQTVPAVNTQICFEVMECYLNGAYPYMDGLLVTDGFVSEDIRNTQQIKQENLEIGAAE